MPQMNMNNRPTSSTLENVLRGNLCAGCGACATLAPDAVAMAMSQDGFLRPVQSAPLVSGQETAIAEVCPGLGYRQAGPVANRHELWGPIAGIYQGYASDAALRHRASSGGALSAILVHLLESGAIDHVLQTTDDPDLPIGNRTVLTSNAAEVADASGSRYAPSAPLSDISRYLDSPRRYAFVGKPCDVAALRAMERRDPRIGERFHYLLSFFCAGVPSYAGVREILATLGIDENEVTSFRYRGNGWPGFATALCRDGTQKQMSYVESWGGILSKHLQFRCKLCPDGTGGLADLVCADAWEADAKGYPLFSEREGISLILGRTEKGDALIRDAAARRRITLSPFNISSLESIQPGQTGKRRYTLARITALRFLGRPWPRFDGFYLGRNARRAGIWPNLKNFLGILRRAGQRRL
jgi:coenzyme F420 hydrogenase subunit beta